MMKRPIVVALVMAALILVTAAALRMAESAEMLGAESARRSMQVLLGLVFAGYANIMPKQLKRMRESPSAEARSQSVLRVGGWLLTMAGLSYAALWAFTPLAFADVASIAVVATALLATLGFALWSYKFRPRTSGASARH